MRQEIIRLYDEYTHERLDRRIFMDRLAKMAGGTAAAAALVPALKANYARGVIVPADDPRLQTERGDLRRHGRGAGLPCAPGRCCRRAARRRGDPREPRPQPAYRGRRSAHGIEGFVALAPDFLSPRAARHEMRIQARDDPPARSAADDPECARGDRFLEGHEATTDRVGVIGFC